MKPYLELMRVNNCAMAAIAVLIGYTIVTFDFSIGVALAMVSAFLICGAGQAINDIFDYKIDKKINKKKPIPSGKVSRSNATIFSAILFLVGIILAFFINPLAFTIAVIFSILLILYASVLYKVKYLGNIVVALGTAFTFIFGASVTETIPLLIIIFAMSAFFANMSREITKDFEDLKKDKGFKKTLPMISKKLAKSFAVSYHLLAILFAMLAFAFFLSNNIAYFIMVLLATLTFGRSIKLLLKNDYKRSQKNCKKGMLFSLLAYVTAIIR
ncbi:MAG: geranylgeranylglycerol-phosphate geranylgeranyltransferase [Candidatus Diapherotrites archaeon]|jgi:geranylgeranylglycerol-phosphate geranylgeranyltransferase|uniref:Geranylgeranylglycerol-phosphate geranylgeranyltransferase n=1 Tax=Candidatus Iainarchaeum sp. TaxID=3101447 RepID=A0A8T5GG47_9ARCH|nr:geranylgeranylglycerol-phosphate geranylgeranyltransferase [Candidatus Diapherotrites archaeon]MBT7241154.1 geranylgeranylglycerol-phosphate geranylgeranyltransferase [Candidatus Diapherotrites archaeon]